MKKKNLVVLCFVCLISKLFAGNLITSRRQISPRMNEKILSTLQESQLNVYDYNGDGKINCIDYSCIFKLTWDYNFPEEAYRCELIRNHNGDVMNHLFAGIRDENYNIIEVETWAPNPNQYLMCEVWPEGRYNRDFNYYGETERWLSEGNRVRFSWKTTSPPNENSYTYQSSYSTRSSSSLKGYICFGYTGSLEKGSSSEAEKYGIEFSSETFADAGDIFAIFAVDYFKDYTEGEKIEAFLLGFDWGYGVFDFFQPYFGGTLGVKWNNSFDVENIDFAWKVNGGIRIPISSFCFRADLSYNTIIGTSGTIAAGVTLR
ncbi:hypothetical protein DYE50_03820 [Treponema ruminis]|uniref:EF-hand domain-containing protein n=1 Tax=Treponema ruminis TaxID=744515 RepID=A0A7W8LLF0_9SPIR|nr:hypothetical protein [Treponema ruminis]MBB5225422.1 hypothetical protein [Treponema ruminis]QSI01708.1 hypothetical protein DYE50_03820 [Treponema ruminis]